ncbi:MAG TPA: hypothetical protein VFR47_16920 [Anaerolineales bacterium]|nr:hypothetical protein [Anaerolineales bacterium]
MSLTDAGCGVSTAIPSLANPNGTAKHPIELDLDQPQILSHADRLDPNAVFPDTRSRSLNIHSVSKNVPDRNPLG